jgi:hypothetical protein
MKAFGRHWNAGEILTTEAARFKRVIGVYTREKVGEVCGFESESIRVGKLSAANL